MEGDTGLFSTTIWLNVTSIFAILYSLYICNKSTKSLISGNKIYVVSIISVLTTLLYVGTRPIWCYADTFGYTYIFNAVKYGYWSHLPHDSIEPVWTMIEYFCINQTNASSWLFIIAFFYVVGMSYAAYRLLPNHTLIAIVFIFTSFSFWGYATNTIRQGMAASIAILGLTFFCGTKKHLIIAYSLLTMAALTHKSMSLIIVCTTAALFFRNTNINISFWLLCIVLGLLYQDTFKSLFSWMIDDGRMATYLNAEVDATLFSHTGFRWDFLLYSSMPIIIGWYIISKRKIYNTTYSFILHTYIFSNAFWVLNNSAAYSDRIAYLSWFLYPILIVYPFCKFNIYKKQSALLGTLLILLTAFTYFF